MSTIKFLFDENANPRFKATLLRRQPAIDVLQVGDRGAPPRTTLDPDLLVYLEGARRILVSDNRKSMPGHLQDHWAHGGSCWGIFWIKPGTTFDHLAEDLELIWGTMDAEEWLNTTFWVPAFTRRT